MKNSNTTEKKLLVIGIGNSGRSDDGLGWLFVDCLQNMGLPGIDFEYRYQLQVEDALLVADYEQVIFADATHDSLEKGFAVQDCQPAAHYFFSTHTQSPETILYLAGELYNKKPRAQTLAICGHEWGLGTRISKEAEANLSLALQWFCQQEMAAETAMETDDLSQILN